MWEVRVGECQCQDVGDEGVGQCQLTSGWFIFTNEIRNMITSWEWGADGVWEERWGIKKLFLKVVDSMENSTDISQNGYK